MPHAASPRPPKGQTARPQAEETTPTAPGNPGTAEAIWQKPPPDPQPRTARTPETGKACALAFSTLLSSQGADAHHQEPHNSIRGNPANLPASHMTVKAVSGFGFAGLLHVNQLNSHDSQPTSKSAD